MITNRWFPLALVSLGAISLAQYVLVDSHPMTARVLSLVMLLSLGAVYLLQKRAAARLAAQLDKAEKSVQTILDGISDPILIVDDEFRVTAMNTAARKTLPEGVTNGDIVHCHRALHGLDRPCDPAERPCTLVTGQSGKNLQVVAGEDGQHRMIEFRSTPLHDSSGKLTGVIEVVHDLNEQEETALEIEQVRRNAAAATQARLEFSSTISHEIRTPLNAVLGMIDLLRMTHLKRKQEAYIQIVESSGNMLLSLVDNMLDYATLKSGKLTLDKQEFVAADLLEQVLKVMGYPAYSKSLELIGESGSDLQQRLSADRNRLQQIMVNIVSNAIRYTDEGEIVVRFDIQSTGQSQAALTIEVEDSGIGMSEATQAALFHPYRPATGAAREVRDKGSGLGLAITRQLVELMDGEISIESSLGGGTTARILVPVGLAATASAESTHRGLAFQSRRMLVVVDNRTASDVICRTLRGWGMQCDAIEEPVDVTKTLVAAKVVGQYFDGVIIDNDLPGTDGITLARSIRSDPALAYLPVIMLTSIARPLEVGKISSIGGVRCVNKPLLASELRHNLFSVLEVDDWQGKNEIEQSLPALRILIAEDNPLNMKLLSRMVQSLGHEVDCVDNGSSALQAFENNQYDLILMDCQMPGMDGDEVARRIRTSSDDLSRQPIIVAVTADVSAEHKSRCLQAGMDDFLAKPVRLQILKSALRRWSSLVLDDSQSASPATSMKSDEELEHRALMERLHKRVGNGGKDSVRDFINMFVDDATTRLKIMHAAVEHGDKVTLGRECHALKGACLEVGVSQMGERCDSLRNASNDEQLSVVETALVNLAQEFNRVRKMLEAEKG